MYFCKSNVQQCWLLAETANKRNAIYGRHTKYNVPYSVIHTQTKYAFSNCSGHRERSDGLPNQNHKIAMYFAEGAVEKESDRQH